MQTFGNERVVQQGEEWNLDILLSQSNIEYIPFIVSSERNRPMWAITVASTKYEKNERYVATWWLDMLSGDNPLPRFFQTVPQLLGENISGPVSLPSGDEPMEMLYYYTLASDLIDETLGRKQFHYVYFDENYEPHYDYECRIRMQFQSSETAEWGSQNYMYQITLVDTVSMAQHIQDAHDSHEYSYLKWPKWITYQEYIDSGSELTWEEFRDEWIINNVNELFYFIKNRISNWFQPDIDVDSLAGQIDRPQVILPPTRLQVNNNLRRII